MEETTRCPRCTRQIAYDDRVCPFCDLKLDALSFEPPPPSKSPLRPREITPEEDDSEPFSRVPRFMHEESKDRNWSPHLPSAPTVGRRLLRILFFSGVGGAILFWIFAARSSEPPPIVSHPYEARRANAIKERMAEFASSQEAGAGKDAAAARPQTPPPEPASKSSTQSQEIVYDKSLPPVKPEKEVPPMGPTVDAPPAKPDPEDRISERETLITGEGLKGTYFESEGSPILKGAWVFRGKVYDLMSLAPLDAVQIVFKNPETGKTYETYTQHGGRYRADVPQTQGSGYNIRIARADYHSAYEFGRIETMKTVPTSKRKKIADELSKSLANTDPVLPAGKKKSLDIFLTHR